VREVMERFPPDEVVMREQYLDFLLGRTFRESLFCLADVPLQRTVAASCVKQYWLSANAAVKLPSESGSAAVFVQTAMSRLREAWPQSIRFDELAAAVRAEPGSPVPAGT